MVHLLVIHRCHYVYLNYFVSMCQHCPCVGDADYQVVYLCRLLHLRYLMVRSPNHDCHSDRMRQRHIATAMLLFVQQHYKYYQCYCHALYCHVMLFGLMGMVDAHLHETRCVLCSIAVIVVVSSHTQHLRCHTINHIISNMFLCVGFLSLGLVARADLFKCNVQLLTTIMQS